MLKVTNTVCPNIKKTFEKISLSAYTVTERIREMSDNFDESMDVSDSTRCSIYVRGIDKYLEVAEQLLYLASMKGRTTGVNVFSVLERVVVHSEKLVCLATDGLLSTVGSEYRLAGRL